MVEELGLLDALASLNERQRRAVEHDGAPLVVLAGPGSGKTRVIVTRVARLIAPAEAGGVGAAPESVLALAFTIKSAQEIRDRLIALVGPSRAARVGASTCHAFGRGVIRRFGDAIGLPVVTRVMDSAERRRLLREILRESPFFLGSAAAGLDAAADHACSFIEACTRDGVTPARLAEWCDEESLALDHPDATEDERALDARRATLDETQSLGRVYAEFDERRLAHGLMLLDDYINLPARILREHAPARAILRDDVRHIVVDEFQDWSPAQIELLRLLAPSDARPGADLCVVGDDDQAIYAFRGADDRAFTRFAAHWPDYTEITLDQNYRSRSRIIETGNRIIRAAESRFRGEKTIVVADSVSAQSPGVVESLIYDTKEELPEAVAALVLADHAETDRPWSDYAVLVRTNSRLDEIAFTFATYDIPVRTPARAKPGDDAAVQDLLSWMWLLADPRRTGDLQRLLLRPPVRLSPRRVAEIMREARGRMKAGGVALDAVRDAAACEPALTDFLTRHDELLALVVELPAAAAVRRIVETTRLLHIETLDRSARAERVAAVLAALRFAQDKQPRLERPGDLAALLRHYDALDDKKKSLEIADGDMLDGDADDAGRPDAVSILTAHKAKGLEFDTVIVADVRPSKTGFPMSAQKSDPAELPGSLTGRAPTSHADEERRLFYVACTRAERRLVLVGRKLKRKPKHGDFFDEIAGLNPEPWLHQIDVEALRERAGVAETADLPGAAPGAAASRRARIHREITNARQDALDALHRAERRDLSADDLDTIATDLNRAALRLAALAHLRDTGAVPDGLGESEAMRALADRLDHAAPPILAPLRAPLSLSYTKITDYERCPRCFYVKHVLRLDEEKTPGLAIGDIVHRALEKFFNEVRGADATHDGPAPTLPRLLAIARQLAQELSPTDETPAEVLTQIDAQLTGAYETLHTPDAEILEIECSIPFTISLECGEHHCLAKIDRVDRRQDGSFRLIDYKTGKALKKLTEPKRDDLQLCLYSMALRRLYEIDPDEPLPGVAEYWLLATRERGVIALEDLDLARALKKINKAAEGMLAGRFEKKPKCKGLCALLPDSIE